MKAREHADLPDAKEWVDPDRQCQPEECDAHDACDHRLEQQRTPTHQTRPRHAARPYRNPFLFVISRASGMTAGDRTRALGRWLAARMPRQILCIGWVIFCLGCYPGYLSTDSVLQLYSVRSGEYTDYSPVMSAVWGALEYVSAGPFPMLALQSGLLLFGLSALLRRVVVPRAAALTAVAIVVFPPVFTVMAVIWPDPFMAAMLIAGFAAVLESQRGWRIAGAVMIALAVATRREVVLAKIP